MNTDKRMSENYKQNVKEFFAERYSSWEVIKIGNRLEIPQSKYWNQFLTGEQLAELFVPLVFQMEKISQMFSIILEDDELYREEIKKFRDEWENIQNGKVDFTLDISEKNFEDETSKKRKLANMTGKNGIILKENLTAIIIGVDTYQYGSGFYDSFYCSKDAGELAAFLQYNWEIPEERIHLFTGKVMYDKVLPEIMKICGSLTEKDKLLFYYAGKGACSSEGAYLMMSDTRIFQDEPKWAIPLHQLNEMIRKCKAKVKVRIFDSMLYQDEMSSVFEEEAFAAGNDWITFMPCSLGEFAYELKELNHGVFSYFLLLGLKGEARRMKELEEPMYLEDLKIYLSNSVPAYVSQLDGAGSQNPQYHCEINRNIIIS